eukprot:TRINITY_DN626_c0_g1_i2.p1 TRINITY_DN626_c0_g1~~TRINITY_DN626_c0_g1_i2.p1  ORF type:complete len:153 (-),score=25.25 TRINITY_DN626_c0_g1_i2:75-533(-)
MSALRVLRTETNLWFSELTIFHLPILIVPGILQAVKTGVAFEYSFFLAAYEFAETASSLAENERRSKAKLIYDEFLAQGAPKEIMVSALILRDLESKLDDAKPEIFSRAMIEVGFILEPQCIGYARQYNIDLDTVKQMTKINLRPTFSSGSS